VPSTPVSRLPTTTPVPSMPNSSHTRGAFTAATPGAVPIPAAAAADRETGAMSSTTRSGSMRATSSRAARVRITATGAVTTTELTSQWGR